jgi:predicted nucleotidyltransferase
MEAMGFVLPQPQLNAIAAVCQEHQVQRMHRFGSALRDDFDPVRSDLDLLVDLKPIEPGALVDAYFFELEQQLASITGQAVDLVMADAVHNPLYGSRHRGLDREICMKFWHLWGFPGPFHPRRAGPTPSEERPLRPDPCLEEAFD